MIAAAEFKGEALRLLLMMMRSFALAMAIGFRYCFHMLAPTSIPR
jgi:hypothetical protein